MSHLAYASAVCVLAYLGAGAFFVLRGLAQARVRPRELGGLALVALCWLPIAVGNLVSLHRAHAVPEMWLQFTTEMAPPLAMVAALVSAAGLLSIA
ncbi:hypothetical protein JNW90_07465 [Micromonospora sp. STR1s_5]|nr:hypothetical protein [Micromonospora sp. STR1s_5]